MIEPTLDQIRPEVELSDDTLSLSGSMTLAHARTLELAGDGLLRGGAVTVDLTEATAVDSSALAVLFAWQRAQTKAGGSLAVRSAPEALQSLAKVYGVTEQLVWL